MNSNEQEIWEREAKLWGITPEEAKAMHEEIERGVDEGYAIVIQRIQESQQE